RHYRRALWDDTIDGGIGQAGERHGLRLYLVALIAPFHGNGLGQGDRGHHQRVPRGRAHRPVIQPDFPSLGGGCVAYLFVKPFHNSGKGSFLVSSSKPSVRQLSAMCGGSGAVTSITPPLG